MHQGLTVYRLPEIRDQLLRVANYPDHLSNTLVRGLIPDPILATATCFFWTGPQIAEVLDQGSVLAVRVFGSLSIYFTPQLEVVPTLMSQASKSWFSI